ncbi:hypothetical protein HDU88_004760 [Geranomyces variabilis]|nr:hypothetical protein HDU88_004760 [Geranomyces variabilis]
MDKVSTPSNDEFRHDVLDYMDGALTYMASQYRRSSNDVKPTDSNPLVDDTVDRGDGELEATGLIVTPDANHLTIAAGAVDLGSTHARSATLR